MLIKGLLLMIIGTEKRGYNLKSVALVTVLTLFTLFMVSLSVFIADKTIARVYGDTYVTTGRANADSSEREAK